MFADRSRIAELAQLEPVMVRLHTLDQRAVVPETVEEDVAEVRPVAELDPQFVGAVGRLQEFAFIDSEEPIQLLKNGHRRLADADDADLLGFDERDLYPLAREDACERARGHPTSGAAADDEHAPDWLLLHDLRD